MARRVINQGAAPLLKTKARRGAALLALALLAGTHRTVHHPHRDAREDELICLTVVGR